LQLGIAIDHGRLSLVVADHSSAQPSILETHLVEIGESLDTSLKKALKQLNSSNYRAVVNLSLDDTTFHKIQKPNIPDEERESSVLFLMKDRLAQKIDDSMIACVDYPEGCRHDDQLMVVEVQKGHIQNIVSAIQANHVNLKAIDALELTLGDLFADHPDMNKGISLLVEHDRGVSLLLYRNHALYLIRRLSDVPDLISCLPAPGNVQMADTLMLEVQRTLDYFDSLMGQPTPGQLYLTPSFADLHPLAEHLNDNLAPNVSVLNLNELFEFPEALDSGMQHDLLAAVAASVRRSHA
jgi:MSHA biogenesis protein MshI